ncbi:MAG: hypothetical protein U1E63_15275 [Burkholderiales bacterium]
MMLSRWASVGVGQVSLAIHLYPTPAERPTSYPVLDKSEGIYRFDPTLYESLISTPLSGDLPIDPLYRLPEWCVYIETPGLKHEQSDIAGAWVQLTAWEEEGIPALHIMVDWNDKKPNIGHSVFVPLGHGGLRQSWIALNPIFAADEWFVGPILSLALYLCAENAEINGPRRPTRPIPKRTKKGPRLFPADSPTTWDVGVRIGAALRKAYHEAETSSAPVGTGPSPRPHIRRAHWHGYWTGPKNTPEERKLALKWLPPISVRISDVNNLPSVIHPVER